MSITQDYPLEEIKKHIDNAVKNSGNAIAIGESLIALAMMKYNESSIPFPFIVSDGGIDIEVT